MHGIIYESESTFTATNQEDGFDDTESSITSVSQAARKYRTFLEKVFYGSSNSLIYVERRRMEMRMRQNGAFRGKYIFCSNADSLALILV
jgi:hypothetical protein